MLIDIDPADARPVFRQIADEVRRALATGMIKPDDPLPAVRRLALDLKVNPNTVQHAYRTLEHEGVVYVKRGLGTFIAARPRESARSRQSAVARQIAERMLREAFRHGLLASDLIAALQDIAPTRPRTSGADAEVRHPEPPRVAGTGVGQIDHE